MASAKKNLIETEVQKGEYRLVLVLGLLDGPAVENWLVDDVARVIATFLDGPQRELRASLLIGSTLAAARHYVRNDRQPKDRQLLDTTLAFCAGGIVAPKPRARQRVARGPR